MQWPAAVKQKGQSSDQEGEHHSSRRILVTGSGPVVCLGDGSAVK